MMAGIGIIAASASAASTTARGGDSFAAGAWIGRVFRLRQKPGRIELGRMRLRRGGGLLGRLILCARFRGITRRRIVFRRLWRRACLRGFRVLLGRRRFEHGGEKFFAGDQRGNEERPGQETERAGSLVRTLHPGFEDLLLLFEQFAFFYFFHDRCLSSRSTETQLSPGSIHCRASLFGSGVMHGVVRHVVRQVEMPYVEVIRRAHLVDGVVERMVGRHRSERAVQVTRMIRTVRAIITVGEVELCQRFTRVVIGVALAAVVVLGMIRMVVVLGMLRMVVVLGMLRVVVVLGMLRVVVVLGMLRMVVVLGMLRVVVVLGMLRVVVVLGMLRVVVVLGMLGVVVVLGMLRVVVVLGVLRVVVVLGMLRVVVVLGVLRVVVVLPFLATLVLVVAAVVGLGWLAFLAWDAEILYRLENACNAAQDRHGFAPRLGLATVAGTCLVRITTPSPLLSPTHADGCSGEK